MVLKKRKSVGERRLWGKNGGEKKGHEIHRVEVSLFLFSGLFPHFNRPYLGVSIPLLPTWGSQNAVGRRGGLVRTSRINLLSHLPGKCVPFCSRLAHYLPHKFTASTVGPRQGTFWLDGGLCLGREGVECNPGKLRPSPVSKTIK